MHPACCSSGWIISRGLLGAPHCFVSLWKENDTAQSGCSVTSLAALCSILAVPQHPTTGLASQPSVTRALSMCGRLGRSRHIADTWANVTSIHFQDLWAIAYRMPGQIGQGTRRAPWRLNAFLSKESLWCLILPLFISLISWNDSHLLETEVSIRIFH